MDLIGSFNDVRVLAKIAENFEKKRETDSANLVYNRILEVDPSNEIAIRKTAYLRAIQDPDSIQESELPPIELVSDYETLRSIETNYLMYKRKADEQKEQGNIHLL